MCCLSRKVRMLFGDGSTLNCNITVLLQCMRYLPYSGFYSSGI
uniref:Uncharacterized protein n=1 Tax=Arundo donax TaxID=35708 RepID=A0A0A9A163_ARUDO